MLKRAIDLLISILAITLVSPLFVVVAIGIKLDSSGPVFFRQERVGRYGRKFRIFKFRTMAAAQTKAEMQLTVAGDPRITRVGYWLRRSKFDELPQLLDVLRGTMSLVGPRPEVPKYVDHYPAAWRERLLSVRPGITDFASVHYRNENDLLAQSGDPEQEYIQVILPSKLQYSLHYVENQSLANDIQVLGLTFKIIMAPALSSARNAMRITDANFWSSVEQRMSTLRRRNRAYGMFADAVMVLACWQLTYLFRLGFERWQPERPWYDGYVSIGVVITYVLCTSLTGVPRGLWRFFGFDDFRRLTLGCLLAGLISACWVRMAQLSGVPRAVLVLHPLFCVLMLALARMVWRLLWEHARRQAGAEGFEDRRAIVLGAGELARRLITSIQGHEGWTVLAMLDDDPAKQGLRISGVRVQGRIADLALPHVLAGATHVVLALEGLDASQRDDIVHLARRTGLTIMTVEDALPLRPEFG
jgi:lipopolysaccharide/colanic/teichoic acid biosynthesis glycosyltransferase